MTEPVPIPREVRIASALLTALGAVLGVNGVVALLYRDDLRASAEEDVGSMLPAGQIGTILVVASVVLLLLGVILVLAGAQIRRGQQWARVLAFVVTGVVILFAGVGALAGAGLLAVVLLGAAVGVVALLMQSAVAVFFQPRDTRQPPRS